MKLNAIVAISDKTRGIGIDNHLPWNIKKDSNYFYDVIQTTKDKTKKNVIISGTRTWESTPVESLPFKNCINIIVSNTKTRNDINIKGDLIKIVKTLDEAMTLLNKEYSGLIENIYAIGGKRIYEEAITKEYFNRLYLTRVFGDFNCDTFIFKDDFLNEFIKIENKDLKEQEKLYNVEYNKIFEDNNIKFIFEVYDKI